MVEKVDDNIRVKIKSSIKDTEHTYIIKLQKRMQFLCFSFWEDISGYSIEVQVRKYWGARIKGLPYSPISGYYQYGGRYEVWLPSEFSLPDRIDKLIKSYRSDII